MLFNLSGLCCWAGGNVKPVGSGRNQVGGRQAVARRWSCFLQDKSPGFSVLFITPPCNGRKQTMKPCMCSSPFPTRSSFTSQLPSHTITEAPAKPK